LFYFYFPLFSAFEIKEQNYKGSKFIVYIFT